MTTGGDRRVLATTEAELTVDAAAGGRFASLLVNGNELLLTDSQAGPIWWGCYPMAPFAGRIRFGLLTFAGGEYRLEQNLPPHAIHGTVLDRRWDVVTHGQDRLVMETDLGPGWPFPGRVVHEVQLRPGGLDATLTLETDEPMPAWIGWHPWFRRSIGGHAVELDFEPASMYERGPDGLPTGRLIAPTPRPWDDCLVDLSRPPRLSWPDGLRLEITSSADHWVVYDESEDGVCVEPQTGPPDAINLDVAPVVQPGEPLRAWMAWRWSRGLSASR